MGFRRISILDAALLLVSLVIAGLATAFIYDEGLFGFLSTQKQDDIHRDPLARVIQANNDVRRRLDQDVAWFDVSKTETVFNDDSIFTGNSSSVIVKYLDNTDLSLGAHTLVRLSKNTDDNEIKLTRGQITVELKRNSKKKFILKTANRTLRIALPKSTDDKQDSIIKIQSPDGPSNIPRIEVLQGKIEISQIKTSQLNLSDLDELVEISQNQALELSETEAPRITSMSISKDTADQQASASATSASTNTPATASPPAAPPREVNQKVSAIPNQSSNKKLSALKARTTRKIAATTPSQLDQIAQPISTAVQDQKNPMAKSDKPHQLSLKALSYYTGIDATQSETGASAKVTSKINFGLDLQWTHQLTKKIEAFVSGGIRKEDYEPLTERTLTNKASTMFGFNGGAAISPLSWLYLALGAGFGQVPIIKGSPGAIDIEKVWIPRANLDLKFNFIRTRVIMFGLLGNTSYFLTGKGSGYNVKSAIQYGAGPYFSYDFGMFILSSQLFYTMRKQETTLLTQDLKEGGFNLGLSFPIGGN